MSRKVISIPPFEYIHVLNKNTNITSLVIGPKNFALEDHEDIVSKVCEKMIIIPNLHFVQIQDPVELDQDGLPVFYPNTKLLKQNWSKVETRTREKFKAPFPLYPGEKLKFAPVAMDFVDGNSALHLRALLPFEDASDKRAFGDEWLFIGPGYYVPRQEVEVVRTINKTIIDKNSALRIRAFRKCQDYLGNSRLAGEEWLVKECGLYLPTCSEEIVRLERAVVLDENTALHLEAVCDFEDELGVKRLAGENWILTSENCESHIVDIFERQVAIENRIVLGQDEYCVIINPYDSTTRTNELGSFKLITGEFSFFLNPGESIMGGNIQKVNILTQQEALLVQAKELYTDENGVIYKPGQKWMINGPLRFIPPIEIKVLEKRSVIPLDKNEGIYVRNLKTGVVQTVVGKSYLLNADEVLWEKELSPSVETIYLRDMNLKSRDKTRIISYPCPFNAIMQIYNFKQKKNRIVFGPNLAILEPEEEFTLTSLSGGTPKVSDVVQTLYLRLGPVFSTDQFDVETVDHTRLQLRISYNWFFQITNSDEALKIFTIRDFIGDMCSTLASRIRGYIATLNFEDFHKNADRLIKKSVFGENENGTINTSYKFDSCGLVINDVDIQSVAPSDPNTQRLLQKSVTLAIELATKTIEQEYNIQALFKEQEFKGEIERLRINNEIVLLKKLIELNKLKNQSSVIEKTGLSEAQAQAYKEAALIEVMSKVDLAELEKQSYEIEQEFELRRTDKEYENELLNKSEEQRLQLRRLTENNRIESEKFKEIITSLEPKTLVQLARAGPELQAKLLQGLGLTGYVLTDGNNPINLFGLANNLVKNDK